MLKYLDSTYPTKGGVMITETGLTIFDAFTMPSDQQKIDIQQSAYFQSLLREVLKSLYEDRVRVAGTIGWSYVDNWEWGQYSSRYGVQSYDNKTLQRFYKRTIFDVTDFMTAHGGQ